MNTRSRSASYLRTKPVGRRSNSEIHSTRCETGSVFFQMAEITLFGGRQKLPFSIVGWCLFEVFPESDGKMSRTVVAALFSDFFNPEIAFSEQSDGGIQP